MVTGSTENMANLEPAVTLTHLSTDIQYVNDGLKEQIVLPRISEGLKFTIREL